MLRKFLLSVIIGLFIIVSANSSVLSPGEFLEYNVTYLGISIANVKIYNDGFENHNNNNVAKIRANVFTYGHIPLINAKVNMEGFVDKIGVYSHQFIRNLTIRNNPWEYQKIEFDYKNFLLQNNKWINNKKTSSINLEFDPTYKIHDALGLFFKARLAATAGNKSNIMTYLDEAPFYTKMNFQSQKQLIEIGAISDKVRSVYCTGSANWQKQFGLSGEFEGWFSDDEARVPLKGKLNFIIGKITIELVKYKRNGWTPPKK